MQLKQRPHDRSLLLVREPPRSSRHAPLPCLSSAGTVSGFATVPCEHPGRHPSPNGSEDKGLEIDLESLRELLWTYPDGSPKDHIYESQCDAVRWIDTSVMICDPLTKAGGKGFADRLIPTYTSGYMDLKPTAESQLRKLTASKSCKLLFRS